MATPKPNAPDALAQRIAAIGEIKVADRVLEAAKEALRDFGDHAYLHFLAGRAQVQLGHMEAGLRHLESSLQLQPQQLWVHYETARAQQALGKPALAFKSLGEFLRAHNKPMNKVQLDLSESIIDGQFDRGSRAESLKLYQRLFELGGRRYLTVLRAFEAAIDQGDLVAAEPLFEALGNPQDAWSHLAVARYHSALKQPEMVEKHAVAAAVLLPENPVVALAVADHLVKADRLDAVPDFLERWKTTLGAPEFALLEIVLAGRMQGLQPDLILATGSQFAQKWHFISYLYREAERLPDERQALYEALEARFPSDPDLLMCMANLEVARRNFEAGLGFSTRGMASATDERTRNALRFKLFEIACFTKDMKSAGEQLAALDVDEMEAIQQVAVARYHAELGKWEKALEVLRVMLAGQLELPTEHAQFIIRAAKQAKAQFRVITDLMGRVGPQSESIRYLSSALFQDWVLDEKVESSQAAEVAQSLSVVHSDLLDFKLAALRPARREDLKAQIPGGDGHHRAVFFCADKAYALPALVSLASLLETNLQFSDTEFFLVLEDELIKQAEPAIEALSKHYGVAIQAQPASVIIPNRARLETSYGLFTGGHQLAVAAYYRIYMARYLAETGRFQQILYIDSDTVITHGFEDVLNVSNKGDTLLMARLEVNRPEVRQAIVQHGLPPGMYFNSGVLWFPRVGPALIARLKAAEQAAEKRSHELLFQDQCALNIAFAGAFEPLSPKFNFFAGPRDEAKVLGAQLSERSMLHVLDRPKPWESAYPAGSVIQRFWLSAVQSLLRVVGRKRLAPLIEFTVG